MEAFSHLWKRMSKDVCSGDEAVTYPNQTSRYEVLTPGWRNPETKAWFRIWDSLAMSMRYGPDGKPNGPGRFPHVRIDPISQRPNRCAKAPAKLPRNFYDPDWYRSLDRIQRQNLGAKPEIALTFPPAIIR